MLFFDTIAAFFTALLVIVGIPAVLYARVQLQATFIGSPALLRNMILTICLMGLLSCSNTPGMFLICWALLPFALYPLIAAFPSKASYYSARLALITLSIGTVFIGLGLYLQFNLWQPWPIVTPEPKSFALSCIIIGSAIQSGLFPAHSWLLNSLCAPTAVSALMHAGFINASGLLLLRLISLFQSTPILQLFLAALGSFSIVVGLLTSAIQAEQKRALACSTIAQMGCLFVYASLNLPGLLAAHLFAHAMYKSYAFLGMGFMLQEIEGTHQHQKVLLSLLSGLFFMIVVSMDSGTASHPLLVILAALFGYHMMSFPGSTFFALLNIAFFALILSLWHSFFEWLIPAQPTPTVFLAELLVCASFAIVVLIPILPIKLQRPCYAFFLKLSQPHSDALVLKREVAS